MAVAPGSEIGGTELDRAAALSLDGGGEVTLRKELPVPLRVDAGSHPTLRLDLNAEEWVTEDALLERSVGRSHLERALTVSVGPHALARLVILRRSI